MDFQVHHKRVIQVALVLELWQRRLQSAAGPTIGLLQLVALISAR
jgi:hypothetical protein